MHKNNNLVVIVLDFSENNCFHGQKKYPIIFKIHASVITRVVTVEKRRQKRYS